LGIRLKSILELPVRVHERRSARCQARKSPPLALRAIERRATRWLGYEL